MGAIEVLEDAISGRVTLKRISSITGSRCLPYHWFLVTHYGPP